MQCFNCTRPTYDVYDYTSGDETTNTKTAVAPELIRICPNKPCNPSILSPSCIIKLVKFPCQMTFNIFLLDRKMTDQNFISIGTNTRKYKSPLTIAAILF